VNTLAGLLSVRNTISLDYCWRECGESLLGVCDELVINDCESNDGTWEQVQEWAHQEPRITLVRTPWTDPVATNKWWPEFFNRTREHAKSQMVLAMDADEVLHEEDFGLIRSASNAGKVLYFKRLNFWKDPRHLIPKGQCCGTQVVRLAPRHLPLPSDYPYPPADETVSMAEQSDIRTFHYGFLRKREAFFKKARTVQRIWANDFDPRLARAEREEGNWMVNPVVAPWVNDLTEYNGNHPKFIHQWLKERDYDY
jgi:glycosyltransferase involved in cell wall biosynthesis